MNKIYDMNFRCYFEGSENKTNHYQSMELQDIPKWIEAYRFTHPTLQSITVKVWMKNKDKD